MSAHDAIIDQMRSTPEGIALCWLGNLGWLLHAEGRFIAFDLDLDLDLRLQPSPIPTEEIAKVLDVHFITHWHGDHFNPTTCRVLAEKSACLFVIPANVSSDAIGYTGGLVLVGIGVTAAIGQLLMTEAYRHTTITTGSLLSMAIPAMNLFVGGFIFKEDISAKGIFGSIIILASCTLVIALDHGPDRAETPAND